MMDNNNMALSIIVPVYNTEKYLYKCLDSIVDYEWKINYEIIVINDGSTDGSAKICSEYASKFSCIKYIEIENAGLSNARNLGIQMSCGEYLAFLDSDDSFDAASVQKMVQIALKTKTDIVTGEVMRCVEGYPYEERFHRTYLSEGSYDCRDFLLLNLKHKSISMCSQFNIYNKDKIMGIGIFFEKGLIHEDELWTPQIFLACDTVYYTTEKFYYSIRRSNSITTSKKQEKPAKDLIYICNKLEKVYREKCEGELLGELLDYIAVLYMGAYQKGRLYKFNVDRSFPLRNAKNKSTLIKAQLLRINGRVFCIFYSLFEKTKMKVLSKCVFK